MNEIILITGAARGIGLEVARQLVSEGKQVILTARTMEKAVEAAREIGGENVVPMTLNVIDADSISTAVSQVETQFGHLDILINNAAGYVEWSQKPSTADLAAVEQALNVNLFGTWRVIQAFLPLLDRSSSPRIINVGSGAGLYSDSNFGLYQNEGFAAGYAISKAALHALTVKLQAELGEKMLIIAAGPGLTATAPGMEQMGARPIAEGAASIVWAALQADQEASGYFYRDGTRLAW